MSNREESTVELDRKINSAFTSVHSMVQLSSVASTLKITDQPFIVCPDEMVLVTNILASDLSVESLLN